MSTGSRKWCRFRHRMRTCSMGPSVDCSADRSKTWAGDEQLGSGHAVRSSIATSSSVLGAFLLGLYGAGAGMVRLRTSTVSPSDTRPGAQTAATISATTDGQGERLAGGAGVDLVRAAGCARTTSGRRGRWGRSGVRRHGRDRLPRTAAGAAKRGGAGTRFSGPFGNEMTSRQELRIRAGSRIFPST